MIWRGRARERETVTRGMDAPKARANRADVQGERPWLVDGDGDGDGGKESEMNAIAIALSASPVLLLPPVPFPHSLSHHPLLSFSSSYRAL